MQEINDIVTQALSAQSVDEARRQNLVQEVLDFLDDRDAFAAEVTNYDSDEGTASTMTSVWNDEIRRVETNSSPLGGKNEILVRRDQDDYFFGFEMPEMLSMMGGQQSSSDEKQYLHVDEEGMEDFMNISIPDSDYDYDYVVQNGDVFVEGNSVFFDCYIGTSDVEWLNEDDYKGDTTTEGLHNILVYDTDEERLAYSLESVVNEDGNNLHVIKDFLYGVTFDFQIPSVDDDNVTSMDEMGGLGGNLLGGNNPFDMDSDDDDEGLFGNLSNRGF